MTDFNKMKNTLIYSFKANGGGCRVSGRVCATDINDATSQVQVIIKGYGPMNVNLNQLKNQKTAMAKWLREHGIITLTPREARCLGNLLCKNEDKELNAIADSRAGQTRVSVNLDDL